MPQISLEPDMCCEHICFEVEDYAPMVMTDLPDYSGATTVTPSMDAQTLETANTALHDNITVEAIPYDEVEAATPVISVDSGGKVTATTNQQGGIVESSTKSAEYQQPTVEQATPDISVASDGVITATATQTGGFVAGGSKTATLAQETVEQATPTISVDNAGKITASATQTAGFVAAGTKSASYSLPTQAARTVTPSTAAQTAVSAGKWTTGAVEVAAMPTAAQAVPSISMSGGTITATAEQQAGYVEAGTKQAQMSLPTATAATIIPSTASQQAIGAGVFALGSIGVAPIPSEYIVPSGTSEITQNGTFDVTQYSAASVNVPVPPQPSGTLSISENGAYDVASYASANVNVAGGGGISVDDLATDGLTGSIYLTASAIRGYAFYSQNMSGVNAPNVKTINTTAFYNCASLTTLNFPVATEIGSNAFNGCINLPTVSFPNVTSIEAYAFQNCLSLTTVILQNVKSIGRSAFNTCKNLVELNLGGVDSIPTLGINVFNTTPIGGYSTSDGRYGSVFVPASLYSSFLTANMWSSISSRIVSV